MSSSQSQDYHRNNLGLPLNPRPTNNLNQKQQQQQQQIINQYSRSPPPPPPSLPQPPNLLNDQYINSYHLDSRRPSKTEINYSQYSEENRNNQFNSTDNINQNLGFYPPTASSSTNSITNNNYQSTLTTNNNNYSRPYPPSPVLPRIPASPYESSPPPPPPPPPSSSKPSYTSSRIQSVLISEQFEDYSSYNNYDRRESSEVGGIGVGGEGDSGTITGNSSNSNSIISMYGKQSGGNSPLDSFSPPTSTPSSSYSGQPSSSSQYQKSSYDYTASSQNSPPLTRAITQPISQPTRPNYPISSLSAYPQPHHTNSSSSSNYTISPVTYESNPPPPLIPTPLPTSTSRLNGARPLPPNPSSNSNNYSDYQIRDRSSIASSTRSGSIPSNNRAPPPSDAFYPMPSTYGGTGVDERGGRFSIASGSSTSNNSNGNGNTYNTRPKILTTPPISQINLINRDSTRRNESISSLGSASVSTFSSSGGGGNNYSNNGRKQSYTDTLSPHTSITPLNSMRRGDSNTSSILDVNSPISEFFNPALLSNIAVFVKDRVPRGNRIKGVVEHPESFTGEELINTIQTILPTTTGLDTRRYALQIARNLETSLYFHEIDWDPGNLYDKGAKSRVYVFPEDEIFSINNNNNNDNGMDLNSSAGDLNEIPTGVLTILTGCYSPFCGKLGDDLSVGSCYSYDCPNKSSNRLARQPSIASNHSDLLEEADDWATSVPKSLVESLPKKEVQRQSLIFELISGEHKYFNDLEIIEQGFTIPLRESQPPIISPFKIDEFLSQTLLNISSIRDHSRSFLTALTTRQKEKPYIVRAIGDVILQAALDWGKDYIAFTVGFPLAESYFKEEKATNPRFNDFLMDFHKFPSAEKRGFDTFHSRPTFRGLRYTLLLDQILKNTLEDDPDREYLLEAISVIRQQSLEANEGISATKSIVACRDYSRDLIKRPGDPLNLNLLSDQRHHYLSTKVYRRAEGSGFTEWADNYLILFDHYLVVTKPPRLERDGRNKFAIARRAVPLELIQLKASSFSEPPVSRSSGFHLRSAQSTPVESPTSALVYPITFAQIGRYGGLVTYFVDSPAVRDDWKKKLRAAIAARLQHQEDNQVVRLELLSDSTFGATTFGSLTPEAPASTQFGKPTTSCPLTTGGEGQARIDLVVVGSPKGLFIGYEGKPRSMTQVVHLSDITQCCVLQEFGFILVVANKVLIAYSLEALVPSRTKSESGATTSKVPQRLSGQKEVQFFRVGKVGDANNSRTLVIYVKKSGVKESVFKALEPVANSDRSGAPHRFLGLKLNNDAQWFRNYKEFFFPSSVSSIEFLRNKLAIVGSKGVEIMDIESLRTMTVPDFSHFKTPDMVALSKRCEEGKTLGMFRLIDNVFILVYNEFAFHIDKHGEPLFSDQFGLMDLESKPEQIAFHSPYLYAISPSLIEIRNAFTGELCQVITGNQMSLTFDGSGTDFGKDTTKESERCVHFTSRVGSYFVLKKMVPINIEGRSISRR